MDPVTPPTYEQRPPTIQALQRTLSSDEAIVWWVNSVLGELEADMNGQLGMANRPGLYIGYEGVPTLRTWIGDIPINVGDWVVKDETGMFQVLNDEYFTKTYKKS